MAYLASGFWTLGPAGFVNGIQLQDHRYVTVDARAVVETANYFNARAASLTTGDTILVTSGWTTSGAGTVAILYTVIKTGVNITLVRTPLT